MTEAITATRWPVTELVAGFERQSGGWLEARGRLTGPSDGPVAIVLGGISAGRRLFEDETGPGWWPGVAGPDGALDPCTRACLSVDFLSEDATPFPSIEDQGAAALALAEAAGLEEISVIGVSYGGVIALEVARQAPDRIRKVDVLCAAARPNPMAVAWHSIQRDIVELAGDAPIGVDIARRLAMTTYRTAAEFDQRFDDPEPGSRDAAGVAAYLAAAGERYSACTSASRFLALSLSMDSADVAVEAIKAPVRYLSVTSDQLVRPIDIRRTAARTPNAELVEIDSLYGHNGFLKEVDAVNAFLRGEL